MTTSSGMFRGQQNYSQLRLCSSEHNFSQLWAPLSPEVTQLCVQ